MKTTILSLNLTLVLLIAQFSFAQQLFRIHELDEFYYQNMNQQSIDIDTSLIKMHTLFYDLNVNFASSILEQKMNEIRLQIPFLNNKLLDLTLEQFTVHSDFIDVMRQTSTGLRTEPYSPSFKTYKINTKNDVEIRGVFIFSNKGVKAVFTLDNQTYQIDLFSENLKGDKIYCMMNHQHSPIAFDFICNQDLLDEEPIHHSPRLGSSSQKCVELIMEIDYHTFNTFNNYQESIDWALEILAVSSILYEEEIDISLVSNFAKVWEIEDPYSIFIEDANSMLYAIRDNWMNSEELLDVDRDLVHLFSKRNNTGTGGIAFLNGVNSNLNGYGFSSNLTDDTTYSDIPVPYFFWNIYCFMHELGHNFGAKHTQWCGWPGGPIDNCVDIEEVNSGECINYVNNPAPQIGTIMSYCHTWTYQAGGGIVMKLHDLVKADMVDYFSPIDLQICNSEDVSVGCMDEIACNYNEMADLEDGSCIYSDGVFDCFGECLNDQNNNGICDENEQLELTNIEGASIFLYPNPTTHFLNIQTDNLNLELSTLELYNSVGQLIHRSNINDNLKIDISMIPGGIYLAHILLESEIIKQSIIIQ